MTKDIELELSAHNLDCKIDALKAEITEVYYDDDKLELLVEYSMKLGEEYAQRDFSKKLEGCVVVPVNNTTIVAIEKMVEQQVEASGITEDVFRLDGEKILNAAVEAARGGK